MPLRSTRACVLPALEVKWVPTGTTRLQMYFTLFTETAECGKTAYTETALSLVVDLRSSEPARELDRAATTRPGSG